MSLLDLFFPLSAARGLRVPGALRDSPESVAGVVLGTGRRGVSSSTNTKAAADTQPSQGDFLRRLFCALEQENIRYCVLQRWDALLQELDTDHDIDLAVHPHDASKLPFVWQALSEQGYRPIHCLNHAVNSYAFVFAWFEDIALRSVMVDVAFDHRQSGLIWKSAKELVAARQRPGKFWVADPATEFAYLLVKKMLKGTFKAARVQRYKLLVERMGRSQAEEIAGEVFGEKNKKEVVEACLSGNPGPTLSRLKRQFLWKSYARNPLNVVRYLVADYLRLGRRLFRLTGVSLAIVGSNEAAKVAILGRLLEVLTPTFGSHEVYCPPGSMAPVRRSDAQRDDAQPRRAKGTLSSALNLCGSFLHFWVSYVLRIRPRLVRSGLVVFDSCYQEVLADGSIMGNGGPAWLAQLLNRLAPQPNVLLALEPRSKNPGDAQRVATDQMIEETVREASQVFLEFMVKRFESQHPRWVSAAE